jgi:hypothetical protein
LRVTVTEPIRGPGKTRTADAEPGFRGQETSTGTSSEEPGKKISTFNGAPPPSFSIRPFRASTSSLGLPHTLPSERPRNVVVDPDRILTSSSLTRAARKTKLLGDRLRWPGVT